MVNYHRYIAYLFYFVSLVFCANANAQITVIKKNDQIYGTLVQDGITKTAFLSAYIPESKTNIIQMAKNRLFDETGFYSGIPSLKQVLSYNGFTIDIVKKQIIKKANTVNPCKNFKRNWKVDKEYTCPGDAANAELKNVCTGQISNCTLKNLYAERSPADGGKLISTFPDTAEISKIFVEYSFNYAGNPTSDKIYVIVYAGTPIAAAQDLVLSDDQLYDIIVGKSEIIPNNGWVGVTEIYTPLNNFELTKNQAYLQLLALLNGKPSDSTDTTTTPNADGSTSLPSFCNYAKPLCDFVTWVMEDVVGLGENDEVDIKSSEINEHHSLDDQYITYANFCPTPINHTFQIMGNEWEYNFEFNFLCDYASGIAPYLLMMSYLAGAFIVAGVRNA